MMKRGNTEAETLRLNGWGVGDILLGVGAHYECLLRILITAVGEEGFLCRWAKGLDGDFGPEQSQTTLGFREWTKVGVRGGETSRPKYKDAGSPETMVIEECSELIQALCKADRFGWFNYHPDRPASTNMDDVLREMDDVIEVMNRLDIHLRELRIAWFKGEI